MEIKEAKRLSLKYQYYCDNTVKLELCDRPNLKVPYVLFHDGREVYTDKDRIVLGLASYDDVKDEDEFILKSMYFLGHEIQHVRSTPDKTWIWGQREGLKVILEKIAEKKVPNKKYNLNTDDDIEDFIKEMKKLGYPISLSVLKDLVHFIMNALEDGRIERIRASKHPSFKKQMIIFRGREWNKHEVTGKNEDELTLIINQVLSLATTSLYQKNFMEHYEGTVVEEKVKNLFKNISLAIIANKNKSCMEQGIEICRKLAEEIAEKANFEDLNDLIKQLIQDSFKDDKGDRSNASNTKDEEGNNNIVDSVFGESDLEIELTEEEYEKLKNSSNGDPMGEGVAVKIKVVDKDGNDITEDIAEKGQKEKNKDNKNNKIKGMPEGLSEDFSNKEKGQKIEDEIDKSLRRGKRNVGDTAGSCDDVDIEGKIKERMKEAAIEARGEAKTIENAAKNLKDPNRCLTTDDTPEPEVSDINSKHYRINVKFNEYKREYSVSDIAPSYLMAQINTFKRKIDTFFNNQETLSVRNRKTGVIDNRNIHKLAMKQIDVFYKKGIKYKFDGCCYILCDNSGSMGYGDNSKRSEACRAMAMVEKAFDDKMPLKLVAFDASGDNVVHHEVIKNWNERFKNSTAYNFLKKGRAGGCNKDGYSIRVATKELLARPEKQKILFVLSDGTPSAYSGNGINDTSDAVDEARKAGIEVVSIFFPDYYSTDEVSEFKRMYKFNTITTTPEGITNELVRILKRFIGC